MKKIIYILPLVLFTLVFFTCRKEDNSAANGIVGYWQFVSARGGFTGGQVIIPHGKELYNFRRDSTFNHTRNDTVLATGSYHIGSVKSIFTGSMAPCISFNSTAGQPSVLFVIRNDTLTLTDNHVEPFASKFVRVK